jgi:hypothetical protein
MGAEAKKRDKAIAPMPRQAARGLSVSGRTMSVEDKKTGNPAPKKPPVTESKTAEPAPKSEGVKSEGVKAEGNKPDAAPSNKGMGEGQKPVSQAYKDNWNAIFAKKQKKKR